MKPASPPGVRSQGPELAALNVDAGNHPVCTDPDELRAALQAGERSWRRFTYYEQRYAERGQRFTRSDSAWLVTLAGQEAALIDDRIRWLGRLLASRGMPRWLLELHLESLHDELTAILPGRAKIYQSLLDAAQMLRTERHSHIDESVFTALTAAFAAEVGDEWNARWPETGTLLVAAVADESAGITQAVTSIVGWMTDPTRFPDHWCAAVERTIAAAREQARPAPDSELAVRP